ncbi:MAG: hypothetical protein DWQ01_10115 [Planctomycetota bacterium]|nr:MAG: hypothetical protein DWQ01_10115 [Planctomycetota bacterium]
MMDSKGNLFISNFQSTHISKISPDGKVSRFAESPLGPAGMAIDRHDHLFVTIFGSVQGEGQSVLRITPEGQVETYLDSPDLEAPVGIAIDNQNILYVANGRDGRIFRSTEAGSLELFSCVPLSLGRGSVRHMDWANGTLFVSTGAGAVFRIDRRGVVQYIMVYGSSPSSDVPSSPLLMECNGLAAAPDGETLYLGTLVEGKRTLIKIQNLVPKTRRHGWGALRSGQLELAGQVFESLLEAEPANPQDSFGLALVRLRTEQFVEAVPLLKTAASNPKLRNKAWHGIMMAYLLAGDLDLAFAAMEEALQKGHTQRNFLRGDRDLKPLRSDPRWQDLMQEESTKPDK